MSYKLCINPGTDKCRDFFNYLAGDKRRLSRAWPDNVGLTEAVKIGIDAEDYGWYLDDLQNSSSIVRVPDEDGHKDAEFHISLENMSPGTAGVLESLSRATNRLGHAHLNGVYYLTEDHAKVPVSREQKPVPFQR